MPCGNQTYPDIKVKKREEEKGKERKSEKATSK
jgi:hypothetical protein